MPSQVSDCVNRCGLSCHGSTSVWQLLSMIMLVCGRPQSRRKRNSATHRQLRSLCGPMKKPCRSHSKTNAKMCARIRVSQQHHWNVSSVFFAFQIHIISHDSRNHPCDCNMHIGNKLAMIVARRPEDENVSWNDPRSCAGAIWKR